MGKMEKTVGANIPIIFKQTNKKMLDWIQGGKKPTSVYYLRETYLQ